MNQRAHPKNGSVGNYKEEIIIITHYHKYKIEQKINFDNSFYEKSYQSITLSNVIGRVVSIKLPKCTYFL